jgi:hypothetical protein
MVLTCESPTGKNVHEKVGNKTKCGMTLKDGWHDSENEVNCAGCLGNGNRWGGKKYAAGHYGVIAKHWF